jgi:hypothetical protein
MFAIITIHFGVNTVSYYEHKHFESDPDQPKEKIGTYDERCVNCGSTFGEHYNGRCPRDPNEEVE